MHTVLRFRAEHPDLHSAEVAREPGATLARPLTSPGVRQILHRAREKFAALLVEEVSHTLENPAKDQCEEELVDLGLWQYCKPHLHQRGQAP